MLSSVEPNRTAIQAYFAPDALPLVRVLGDDRCMHVLARHNAAAWVDIPLLAGNVLVGKLSCDLQGDVTPVEGTAGRIDSKLSGRILGFFQLVTMVACHLDLLYRREVENDHNIPTADMRRLIEECTTLDQLFDFCTTRMAAMLDCLYGSILLRSKDVLGGDVLVLRKTSFGPSKHLELVEGGGTYRLAKDGICDAEQGITPWVAHTRRSVCLHDLGDRTLTERKLLEYDRHLVWSNKIRDSEDHGDLLIVAVPDSMGDTVAVLRYTQRRHRSDLGHFMNQDQLWLERVARRFLGPQLELLVRREAEVIRKNAAVEISAVSIRERVLDSDVTDDLKQTMLKTIPTTPGQKTYLLNVIQPDGETFRHYAIQSSLDGRPEDDYRLEGSLTGLAWERNNEPVIFLNDLASATRSGHYRPVFGDAVCALAARIAFGDICYGALVVLSNRHDLSKDIHGPALKLLADRTAELLRVREAKDALSKAENQLGVLRRQSTAMERRLRDIQRESGSFVDQTLFIFARSQRQFMDAWHSNGGSEISGLEAPYRTVLVDDVLSDAADHIGSMLETRLDLTRQIEPAGVSVTLPEGFLKITMMFMLQCIVSFSRHIRVITWVTSNKQNEESRDLNIEMIGDASQRLPDRGGMDDICDVLQSINLAPTQYYLGRPLQNLEHSYRMNGCIHDLAIDDVGDSKCVRCVLRLPIACEVDTVSVL